ncbi:hypothetical protein CIC12_28950 [Burkholderia sp. SG-MS1]|nr:hypothetical protein [Paraburkholderia sp. SG-MS1]
MKSLVSVAALAAAFAVPAPSSAQVEVPLSRGDVRAQLVQFEKAGYKPNMSDPYYPSTVLAAQARVTAEALPQAPTQTSDYGSVADGTSQMGGIHPRR